MSERPQLDASIRDRVGTRYSRRLRDTGRLPAVIYGHGKTPVAISFDQRKLLNLLHDGTHLLDVAVEDGRRQTCLVKELQFGYLGDNVIHVDLTRVDLDEEVSVAAHLHFVGTMAAAEQPGAVLTHEMTELQVQCKAGNIPDEIVVELSKAGDETVVTVADVELPAGVKTELPDSTVIASVSFIAEEDDAEATEVSEDGAAEPEVITEAKPAEDGGE